MKPRFLLLQTENCIRQEAKRWPRTVYQKNTEADEQAVS
jgi:hypothetical protein